jgi:putative nucleotidyltransferase with HDIG domain
MNHILCHPALEQCLSQISGQVELPALPQVYLKIQKALASDKTDAKSLAQLVESDPSLTMRILRTVNSAAYGRRQVKDIVQAIALLGFAEIKNLALAAKVIQQMTPTRTGERILDITRFWEHSVAVAVGCRVLARHCPVIDKEDREECFVAGLVHDFGKLVQQQMFPDDMSKVLNLCRQDGLSMFMAEQKIFGFSHQDSGAYLADSWDLSRNLVKSVELHNTPDLLDEDDDSFPMVSLVHVANILARFMNMGYGGEPFIPPFHAQCFAVLELQVRKIPELCEEIKEAYEEVMAVFREDLP